MSQHNLEERVSLLEQSHVTLNRVTAELVQHARDTNHNATILLGVTSSQGQDIRAIKEDVAAVKADVTEIKERLDRIENRLDTILSLLGGKES